MSIVNGIIEAPDRLVADVQAILGESSTKLSELCTSAKINPWSLCKPVALAQTFPDRTNVDTVVTETGKNGITTTTITRKESAWYRGDNHQCGFYIHAYSSAAAVGTPHPLDWVYFPPKGGASQSFRLADFIGYWKDARPPFSGLNFPNIVYAGQTCTVSLASGLSPETSSAAYHKNITLADIYLIGVGQMSELAFGCIIFDNNGTAVASAVESKYLTPGTVPTRNSVSITIPNSVTEGTELRFVPFFCNQQYDSQGRPILPNDWVMKYYSVPGMASYYAEAKSNSSTGSVSQATGMNSGLYAIFKVRPSLAGSNSYKISGLSIQVSASSGSDATVSMIGLRLYFNNTVVWYQNLPNVTISSSSPWHEEFFLTSPPSSLCAETGGRWKMGKYQVELDCTISNGSTGGSFHRKISVITPSTNNETIIE